MSLARFRGSNSKTPSAEYHPVYADGRPVVVEAESSEKSRLCIINVGMSTPKQEFT
jgi:hypothetical protein